VPYRSRTAGKQSNKRSSIAEKQELIPETASPGFSTGCGAALGMAAVLSTAMSTGAMN